MFALWKKRKGNEATVEALRQALEEAGIHEHEEPDDQLLEGEHVFKVGKSWREGEAEVDGRGEERWG